MTNEEEFEELALLEEFEASQPAPQKEVHTSALEAGVRGAAQAATFNFADEIEAGIDTAREYIGEKEYTSIEDLSNDYNKNLEDARREFSKNKFDHPTADMVGTGVGIVGSMVIPGGLVAKGATWTAKAASAAKIGAAYGAFAGVGQSEDKMSLKGALDAAEGAAIGAVGGAAISGAISGVSNLASRVPTGEPKRLINMAFKGIGLNSESARRKFAKDLKRKGVDPVAWLKRISKETDVDGNPLVDNITQSFTEIHSKANNKIIKYAEQRDDILKSVSVKMSREDVAKQLKSALVSSKGSTAKDAAFLDGLIDDVVVMKKGMIKSKDQGEILGKVIDESPLDALSLSQLRKGLDANIKFDSVTNSNAVKKDLRTIFNDITDNLVANNTDEATAAVGKNLRSKMSDLYDLQGSLEKGIEHEQFGDAALVKDLMAGAKAKMMTSWMGKGVGEVAQVTGILLRQMAVSPRINRSMAFNAVRIADSLPNIAEESLRRLLVTAEDGDMVQFNQELASAVAESDLSQDPIPREVDEAFKRKDSIIALAQNYDPGVASTLRKAFSENNKQLVAHMLDKLSKNPGADKFFHSGVGFDGIAYDEEDKATFERQLKTSDIPGAQRIQMLDALRKNGTIPNLEDIVVAPPKTHIPRTKKSHDY